MTNESDNPNAGAAHSKTGTTKHPDPVDLESKIDKCDKLARLLEPGESDTPANSAAQVYRQLHVNRPDTTNDQRTSSSLEKNGLRAEFCYADMAADVLENLKAGDVITTTQLLEQPVLIYRGQQIIATAELSVRDGQYVLNITSTSHDPPAVKR